MTRICVASQNPVKLRAAEAAFKRMFAAETHTASGISVPSGVADQPMTREETLTGARNRAMNAREAAPGFDYWIGIEGGVEDTELGMSCFAWVVVLDGAGRAGYGQTGIFILPTAVAKYVRGGMELGDADDLVFGRENSKQANGAIGLLTDNVIDREAYYIHALVMALTRFKKPQLEW